MLFKAKNVKDAILEAEKFYKCDKKQLKVYIIKSPCKNFWGKVKASGEYEIKTIGSSNEYPLKQQNRDGYIEVSSGEVIITDPLQEGRYATIITNDPQIDVSVNGEKVPGAIFVREGDKVEFKPILVDPVTQIKACLSKDKFQAVLEITKKPGKEYSVKDAKPDNIIFIRSEYKEIQPLVPTMEQCLAELERLNVDKRFINVEKVEELLTRPGGGSAVVAEGKRPINGVNSKIKYLFRSTSYRNPDFDTEKKVNLLEHTIIPTVNIGDILAVKVTPAIPGRDGITATGEVLKARNGKDIQLKAGRGAVLLENDTKVVAVSSGRPSYSKGIISVIPTLVIPHDVDIGTGNVHFDGDIIIKGSIDENLKVTAGGDITVFNNIYRAKVYAKGNVKVHGNIINSKVSAGLNMVNYLCIMPKMKQILGVVETAQDAVNSEKSLKNPRDISTELLKIVVANKNKLDNLFKEIRSLITLLSDEEMDELAGILNKVKDTVTGINAKCIQDIEQIKVLYDEINNYISLIEELYGNQADVIFENGQNSNIQANGNIVVTARGCYQTNLLAKNSILFKKPSSIVRGGLLIARKYIKLGIVGAPSGISTYCRVIDKDGRIDARYYYNNTVLNVNDRITVVEANAYDKKSGRK